VIHISHPYPLGLTRCYTQSLCVFVLSCIPYSLLSSTLLCFPRTSPRTLSSSFSFCTRTCSYTVPDLASSFDDAFHDSQRFRLMIDLFWPFLFLIIYSLLYDPTPRSLFRYGYGYMHFCVPSTSFYSLHFSPLLPRIAMRHRPTVFAFLPPVSSFACSYIQIRISELKRREDAAVFCLFCGTYCV
jgi:hypothetical protein